ncbi:hypothetical protein GCM10018785_27500 [Streptomyces longispororuber]|uniref:Uncharacterized protein n=1 Tax=Streptomyces longispororuber TaxID=68230 RepID=A0A919DLC4_9ACTN|nr:hypothetical protein GCM10018785_27500 [Streptomyces longispororuber]
MFRIVSSVGPGRDHGGEVLTVVNRTRITAAALGTAALVTVGQLGLAGTASASGDATQRSASADKPSSAAPSATRSSGCPIDIVYTSRFYIGSGGWVTGNGLYFGIKNKSTKKFGKVKFTVTNVKNIRFGRATAKGGKITHKTSKSVTVYTKTLKGKAKLGVQVRTRLLNKNSYKVKFQVRGNGWNCAVNQGTWGN